MVCINFINNIIFFVMGLNIEKIVNLYNLIIFFIDGSY